MLGVRLRQVTLLYPVGTEWSDRTTVVSSTKVDAGGHVICRVHLMMGTAAQSVVGQPTQPGHPQSLEMNPDLHSERIMGYEDAQPMSATGGNWMGAAMHRPLEGHLH